MVPAPAGAAVAGAWRHGASGEAGLRQNPYFLGGQFIRRDITIDVLEGEFDLILIIDLIEHIVSEEKLDFAVSNVQCCLADNGTFMVAPVAAQGRYSLFQMGFRAVDDIKRRLSACLFGKLRPFGENSLLIATKSLKQVSSTD